MGADCGGGEEVADKLEWEKIFSKEEEPQGEKIYKTKRKREAAEKREAKKKKREEKEQAKQRKKEEWKAERPARRKRLRFEQNARKKARNRAALSWST